MCKKIKLTPTENAIITNIIIAITETATTSTDKNSYESTVTYTPEIWQQINIIKSKIAK
jgi:hypothetical protein